jgi:DNA-binding transcriptional LysR family regulator
MDLISLTTFIAVARHGSVSAAAQELHTVQSNVTARMKQLEAELGMPLLTRHSRGVALTPAGTRLLAYAQRIVALVAEAQAAVRDDGSARGSLRIGSMETTAAVRLPAILGRYHRDHPQVQLDIRTGTTAELLDHVLAHRIDGALVAGPIHHPDLVCDTVFREELVLVAARDADTIAQRLANNDLTVIAFRQGCTYRHCLDAQFTARGWLPFKRLEFGTLEGILGCVSAGIGVTLLPRSAIEGFSRRADLRIEPLGTKPLIVDTLFVRRADAYVGASLGGFMSVLAAAPAATPVAA